MPIPTQMPRILHLLTDFQAIRAFFSWPKFSITSYSLVSSLKRQGITSRTILDIGANVGQFTVAVAKLFPGVHVHSFEPVPEYFAKLRRNVSKLGNVWIYQMALGDTEGAAVCHINSHSQSSSILSLSKAHLAAFPHAREIDQVPITISTMDAVFEEKQLESPVLLKLDVQGYETHVLRGGEETLKRIQYVIAETSFKSLYQGEPIFLDLVRLMESRGFQFLHPVGWLSDPRNGEILQMDALFSRQV